MTAAESTRTQILNSFKERWNGPVQNNWKGHKVEILSGYFLSCGIGFTTLILASTIGTVASFALTVFATLGFVYNTYSLFADRPLLREHQQPLPTPHINNQPDPQPETPRIIPRVQTSLPQTPPIAQTPTETTQTTNSVDQHVLKAPEGQDEEIEQVD